MTRSVLWLLLPFACGPNENKPSNNNINDGLTDEQWNALSVREKCFAGIGDEVQGMPEYDVFEPIVGRHCSGTDHQDIDNIEKVVFIGDSITAGTPPSLEDEYYRNRLTVMLEDRFGPLEVADCSQWGARTDDLLLDPHKQVLTCFPDVQDKNTLVIMTVGGNDMMAVLEDITEGASAEAVQQSVDRYAAQMRDAIAWFDGEGAARFPAGVSVIFGNVYEFTDATGDVLSCETAALLGYATPAPEDAALLRSAYLSINEQFMSIATDTRRDLLFLLESFCGHGFFAGDPDNECFRGEDAQTWFDATCIHPNPQGHAQIAQMFFDVVSE